MSHDQGPGPKATRTPTRRRPGLAARLLAAQLLVIITTVLTAWLIAGSVGPSIFHEHLTRVAQTDSPAQAQLHAEEAFRDASIISTAVALVVALAVASAVSAYITRRIAGPVTSLAAAAQEVSAGRYDVDIPRPSIGKEFDSLSGSFTAMADRLRSVESTRRRLLGDLAHEMRTPVATLDAYLEAVEDGVEVLDAGTLAMLRSQTRRLSRLAEDVSAVSRAEEHQLDLSISPVAPGQLVTAAIGAAKERYADAGVALDAAVAPVLPEVAVDADRMAQVLGNLLDNALRHTPRAGVVQVRTSTIGDEVLLEVADTGDGIRADHLPHVFERFYRVDAARDRSHGGSGIGLAIVKALVEAHDGHVCVASNGPGTGAVFTVALPAHRGATPRSS